MADMQPLYTPSELPSSPPAYRDVWVLRERGDGDGDEGIIVLTVLRMHSRHLVAASVTS